MDPFVQEKPKHTVDLVISIIAIIIIIACIITGIVLKHQRDNPYAPVNNTRNATEHEIITKRENLSLSPKLEIDFYYLKGCHHCNDVAKVAVPGIRQARKSDNTLVMNAAPKDMHAYLRRNRVYNYPTVAVRYRGYLVYQYSGMNKHIFNEVFHNTNPLTHRQFKRQVPKITYRYNSYTERLMKEPVLTLSNSQTKYHQD